MHPSPKVTGVDLSAIQPVWTAPNVEFQVDDLELDWTFPGNHFDFVHNRHMALGIHNWPKYIAQIYQHKKPGGWVELSEHEQAVHSDDGTHEGSHLAQYFEHYLFAAPKAGLQFQTGEGLAKLLEEAGFVDVKVKAFKQPWGRWPKSPTLKVIGHAFVLTTEQGGLESHGLALFTNFCGMTPEAAKEFCKSCFRDLMERKVHAYNRVWQITGRKPVN